MLKRVAEQLASMEREFPEQGYAARLYYCDVCGTIDGAVAPADELPDDYPCPSCRCPQQPLSDIGRPVFNRAERRLARRRYGRGECA